MACDKLRAKRLHPLVIVSWDAVLARPSPARHRQYPPHPHPLFHTCVQIHGDIATASSVELASAYIINAIVRGKTLPGLPPPPVSGGSAGTPGEEKRGDAEEEEHGQGCVFEAALSVALRQHDEFPHPVSNVWAAGVMVLLHEWMVNRGEFRAAEG